jgi:thymidylate kinase
MTSTGRTGDWNPVALKGPAHAFRGRLLAIEGSDGSGKSHFVSWLMAKVGHSVPCTHVLMPGEHLRSYRYWYRDWQESNDESVAVERSATADIGLALMGVGDRLVRQDAIIEPALRVGHLVVCERFALTPLVFKSDIFVSEPLQRLLRPDVGLLFDAPSDVLLDRVSARVDGAARPRIQRDKQTEVRRFRLLAELNGYRVVDTSSPNDYTGLERVLEELLSGLTREDPADV